MAGGFFDILDGDKARAAIALIDDHQLFDAVLVQQALGLFAVDALGNGDEVFFRHQLVDFLLRVGGEAHVAVGQVFPPACRCLFRPPDCPAIWLMLISASASASVASG